VWGRRDCAINGDDDECVIIRLTTKQLLRTMELERYPSELTHAITTRAGGGVVASRNRT
jgi:hypothetical protein